MIDDGWMSVINDHVEVRTHTYPYLRFFLYHHKIIIKTSSAKKENYILLLN